MTVADPRSQVPMRPPIIPVEPPQKVDILGKITEGLTSWIGNLTGHPKVKKTPSKQQTSTSAQPQQPQGQAPLGQPLQPTSEDSVAEDMKKLKKLVGKLSANVEKSVEPVVQKGSSKASAFGKANQGFLRTVLKIFFVVILLIIVAYIGMQFFKKLPGGDGGEVTPTPEESTMTVTPTPIVYNPTKPSVYAQDPVVLKLEEDVDVLTREISRTNIKETQLNPPALDYAISF
jgi:hypothetical protein